MSSALAVRERRDLYLVDRHRQVLSPGVSVRVQPRYPDRESWALEQIARIDQCDHGDGHLTFSVRFESGLVHQLVVTNAPKQDVFEMDLLLLTDSAGGKDQ